jgi:hypothetical protein
VSCAPADPALVGEPPATSPDASSIFDSGSAIQTADAHNEGSPGIGVQCAGSVSTAVKVPLDIFIMLDQSGSMDSVTGNGHSKWEEVLKALTAFVGRSDAAGIGIGLQYFGVPDPTKACKTTFCRTDADCGSSCGTCVLDGTDSGASFGYCSEAASTDSCNAADYATVEVPIAPLPGNATAIIQSLGRHRPYSGTPTSAALQGSVDYVTAWAAANPTHVAANVFATDGVPSECDADIGHIQTIAANGLAAGVRTFVIGVRGIYDDGPGMPNSLQTLNGVAAAGGTGQAFAVNGNTSQQFLSTLNKIRTTTLGCAYFVPPAEAGLVDLQKVNVLYTPGGETAPITIPFVENKTRCTDDGWYYSDDKKQILMCDFTCQSLTSDLDGKLEIKLGCQTIVK